MRKLTGIIRRRPTPGPVVPVRPATVRAEYTSLGRCGAVPLGEDRPLSPVLPCTEDDGHTTRHVSPSGWTWPNRGR